MTVRFRKKVRRQRGQTTHGWGSKKKHRGGGNLGGRGMAGMHKHKFTLVTTTVPDWYGKKGFHSHRKRDVTINILDMVKISKGKNEIDLSQMGYTKLLSMGNVDRAYTVKVKSCSEKAKEKIEKAGGKVITDKEE